MIEIKRIHLFELEDLKWFPAVFRNLLTDALQFNITAFQIYTPVISLLKKLIHHMNTTQIIDLCSGSSRPWIKLQTQLAYEKHPVSVTLTDKYPNIKAFKRTAELSKNQIQYIEKSVEATNVPAHLTGIRTIFTGFHHFKPNLARAILQNAVDQEAAIGIFEFTGKRLQNLLLTPVITPLTIFLTTPFIKPITFTRIFWTYMIPIIPLATTCLT